jgi:hypothetical protein
MPDTVTQCMLSCGVRRHVAYIPTRFAKVGQLITIDCMSGLWRVDATYTTLPTSTAIERSRDHARQIEGKIPTPRGLTSVRERVQNAIRRMPSGMSVKLIADDWSAPVLVHTPKIEPLDSLVSLRVNLIRVTGEPYPKIRLKSKLEKKRFSLVITKAQAQQLGPHILREIDIDARVRRDSGGYIADGKLLDFSPVDSEDDAATLWRAWYRENASEWDKVEDIESELKR